MGKKKLFVLGLAATLMMLGSVAHSAQITYDTYVPNWVYGTWGQLPGPISETIGNYTITAKGTGTATDPYRFEVSPQLPVVPTGSMPTFTPSNPLQNLQEFGNWVNSLVQQIQSTTQQTHPTQVPEPWIPAMLLTGLFGLSIYRIKSRS